MDQIKPDTQTTLEARPQQKIHIPLSGKSGSDVPCKHGAVNRTAVATPEKALNPAKKKKKLDSHNRHYCIWDFIAGNTV
ncbi:MAG: hypothetical protein AYP45_14205 [Candidatus Brocadia carolinensis]|uniref:Uncharacterized protein n=1 Tax=Candidatus Brocadia carolinensis TaxID=1004156 RepID=A0A1V4AR05_9BACT|nr:MAG: hypothetical protein AYP45_14205 [Candidatus Brocadia caroliniensis]